jgi:hypothetical protein
MCELAFIEYNPTFDAIKPFPCFFDVRIKGLAFETLGPWCKETIDFINVIGDRLIAESGDSKSKKFLFERISLAIQRGNAESIRGTFPDSALLSEIFAL